jgi:hypothetical protein
MGGDMLGGNMAPLFLLGVLVIAVLLMVVITLTRRYAPKSLNQQKYQSDWLAIEQSLTNDPGSWQLAIMNADKLMDRALKERGFKGTTTGERMTTASRTFTKRDAVWAAHKLRNKLAHEDGVRLNPKLTKQALTSFKYALKDLGAL